MSRASVVGLRCSLVSQQRCMCGNLPVSLPDLSLLRDIVLPVEGFLTVSHTSHLVPPLGRYAPFCCCRHLRTTLFRMVAFPSSSLQNSWLHLVFGERGYPWVELWISQDWKCGFFLFPFVLCSSHSPLPSCLVSCHLEQLFFVDEALSCPPPSWLQILV
ncbi:hypothetical protein M404DRAFT_761483 [Pisolithus tinctorius Marx 270]|uniref:Uncharacterized protein n=1 Tax=Pisolithus tinctorius Marx 270 TaxID=870435 RepID=A0A0C3JSR6_PISTI|nr:hypothetical protein M404DRAFT_761483 [Pisolithus tinctorius Marx 270]